MKLTVLVSTYNHGPFVADALESVLQQQVDEPFEILCADDCSTDETRDVVRRYAGRHPQLIRTFFPDRNMGAAGCGMFQALMPELRGEYVAWLDGDDYWTEPTKVQQQIDLLDARPDCSVAFHVADNLYPDGSRRPFFDYEPGREIYALEDIMLENFVCSCSVMHRNGLIRELPDAFFRMPGDWFLLVMLAKHGSLALQNATWGTRRVHPGGAISMKPISEKLALNLEWIQIIDAYLDHRYAEQFAARAEFLQRELASARRDEQSHR